MRSSPSFMDKELPYIDFTLCWSFKLSPQSWATGDVVAEMVAVTVAKAVDAADSAFVL